MYTNHGLLMGGEQCYHVGEVFMDGIVQHVVNTKQASIFFTFIASYHVFQGTLCDTK